MNLPVLVKYSRGAFTLVEVIASAAILVLGMAFVSQTFVRTMEQKSVLALRRDARLLASSKMEEAFSGAPPGEGACPVNKNLRWKRTVRQSPVPGMLEVEVEVVWPESGGLRGVMLRTLLSGE